MRQPWWNCSDSLAVNEKMCNFVPENFYFER